ERGKLAFDQGQYAKSVVHFQKALQLDPSNSATLKYLAGAQFRSKDYQAAAGTYGRAVQADPDDLSTRQYHGMALFESGQLNPAETAFRDVQKRGTETALSYYYLARVAQARGKTADAIVMCEKALQIDPKYETAQALLGSLKAGKAQPAPH
ncbi:MAG: tetratricopeptide repeat protein, partial [Pseudomonadota bacterium]